MKKIKYKFLSAEVNHGTEERPDIEQIFFETTVDWTESNEEIVKQEAYNGEYKIFEEELPVHEQIAELKAQLAATDYKVTKCAECLITGREMPYDAEALHLERQALRDQINELEEEL